MSDKTWWRAAIGAFAILGAATAIVVTTGPAAGAARPLARAVLHNANGDQIGEVIFKGHGHSAERVEVELDLRPGAPGLGSYHGLHVHAVGACTAPAFTSAGGHWNPTGAVHGQHAGDLPSVLVSSDGTAYAEFETHRFDVTQLFDGDGSAVVLHAGPDNFGHIPGVSNSDVNKYQDPNSWYTATGGTASTGDAGARHGCGVVTAA